MVRRSARRVLAAALALGVLACGATACTPSAPRPTGTADPTTSAPAKPEVARLRLPDEPTTLLGAEPDIAASRALFVSAPVVVLAPADDLGAQVAAASAAVALGGPMLLVPTAEAAEATATGGPTGTPTGTATASATGTATPAPAPEPAWATEVERLQPTAVLVVGERTPPQLARLPGVTTVTAPADALAGMLGLAGAPSLVDTSDPLAAVTAVAGLDRDHPGALAPAPEPTTASPPPAGATSTGAATPSPADSLGTTASPAASPSTTPAADSASATATATSAPGLPLTAPAPAPGDGALLTDGDPGTLAAVATARAAGLAAAVVPGGDPRATAETVTAVARVAGQETHVLAAGPTFEALRGPEVDWRVRAAATGVQLPGGGQIVFAHRRLVALYGAPGVPGLGLLGEQDLPATLTRAKDFAGLYQALTDDTVEPSLEIIATVASRGAGDDGNYSDEHPAADLLPWVEAAEREGLFVILDLQPGRTDFLTQAKQYESLLVHPNVGLALDPEWRLKPDQVHLRQIGSVEIAEVNAVVTWLADLTRREHLPQKVLVLHQFSLSMIHDRAALDTSRAELQIVLHVDGQGSQPAKAGTWKALQRDAPAGVLWGWKNFVDEDHPMLTPEQTYRVKPAPVLVTYQ